MRKDEIWFILLDLPNKKKVNLLKLYKDEGKIRKNKDYIKEFKGKI